ncbi:ASCH domain-containing protein [Nonomuraea wenchangensis]|uniref:ASCH domain-containing protein n=1 Tax=Nonomuraea wenchangensis TaxID=568860 RepID=A0A1I0LTI2_9ACTN|nr:hypothetical protein [Nonomuraea wenchangensis]SEU46341.1 hypothetical protein SAMN05421811_1276 [Nonomuraea wenchangensis]
MLKAVTIWQPWSWAVAADLKPVENRTRATRHRGEIAIHAGKHWDEIGACDWRVMEAARSEMPLTADDPRFVFGAIIAVAELVDVTRDGPAPWAEPGQVHWLLAGVRPLADPVPCRGWQNVWDVPPDVEVVVRAQLDRKVRT